VYIVLIIGLTLFEEPGLGYGRVGIARASSSRDVTNRDRPKKKRLEKCVTTWAPGPNLKFFQLQPKRKTPMHTEVNMRNGFNICSEFWSWVLGLGFGKLV